MFISCGQDEPHRSPKEAYFNCLICVYFLSFFYEHPVFDFHFQDLWFLQVRAFQLLNRHQFQKILHQSQSLLLQLPHLMLLNSEMKNMRKLKHLFPSRSVVMFMLRQTRPNSLIDTIASKNGYRWNNALFKLT